MPLVATPVSVATPRCGIWPTVFCGVLAADRRLCPFRLLRRPRNQRARHTDAVGLRDSSERWIHSCATRGSPGGKTPTTGSPTTADIGQAGLFVSSVAQLHLAGDEDGLSAQYPGTSYNAHRPHSRIEQEKPTPSRWVQSSVLAEQSHSALLRDPTRFHSLYCDRQSPTTRVRHRRSLSERVLQG